MTALATTTSTFPSKSIQCRARGQTEGPNMSKLSTSCNFEFFQLSPFSNALNHTTSSNNNEEIQQQRVTLPSARSLISTVDRMLRDKAESDSYNDNYNNNLLSSSYMNYRRDRSSITKPIPKLKERPGPYPQKFSFSCDGNGNPLLKSLPQQLPDAEGRGRLSSVQRADRPSQRKQPSLSGLLTLKDLHLHDRSPRTSISTFSRPSSRISSVTDIDMFDFHDIKDVLERQYDGEPFHLEEKKKEF